MTKQEKIAMFGWRILQKIIERPDGDIDAKEAVSMALELGLLRKEYYDSGIHGEDDWDPWIEDGDLIYVEAE